MYVCVVYITCLYLYVYVFARVSACVQMAVYLYVYLCMLQVCLCNHNCAGLVAVPIVYQRMLCSNPLTNLA